MPGRRSSVRDFAGWVAGRWRGLLIAVVLAPVLGPGIALFCLAAGGHAMFRSRSSEVAGQAGAGERLDALAAAVLPAAVYGCTVWGLRVLVPSAHWAAWVTVSLVAGLVTLAAGFGPAIYLVGYSWGLAQAGAAPGPSGRRAPAMSLSEQVLRPFRRRR
jgi:hypothetical protein